MKREIFKIEGDKIIRARRNCPKCGDGVFLAEHKDRVSCGKCGYTEFKGKEDKTSAKPEVQQPASSEPKEQPPTETSSEPIVSEPESEPQDQSSESPTPSDEQEKQPPSD